MVEGQSYRVGQIGAFLRIPLGYTHLYGVCTQVGADAAPPAPHDLPPTLPAPDEELAPEGYRWLTLSLFGESVGGHFDRGVGQYPTVGDQVHLVTPRDLGMIYRGRTDDDAIIIGRVADSAALPARLQLSTLVSRHTSIVGSTGSGKSNLVAVILESLTDGDFPSARTLIIDPHGEYGSVVSDAGKVIYTGARTDDSKPRLSVPFWALPFDELVHMTMGEMQPHTLEALRDRVASMKREATKHLADPPPIEMITADSPIPFSIRQLWFELEQDQRVTYKESQRQDESTQYPPDDPGDAATLRPPVYPAATATNTAPYLSRRRLQIGRQVDLLHSRLTDNRFTFMFDPDDPLHPDLRGKVRADIDSLLVNWIGGPQTVTVLDVSGLPAEVLGSVVGTMLRLIYDALFWAMDLPVGGRRQPLLLILDEAHRFLPRGDSTPAHRIVSRIAKEGRKYGVGLMVVTQRPSDIDPAILSQCGTMISLRVTNGGDRNAVTASIPDDLDGLAALLPSLRTGEALVLGDALHVPSRIRVRKARRKPVGDDPELPSAWRKRQRPPHHLYKAAVRNWRSQSTTASREQGDESG